MIRLVFVTLLQFFSSLVLAQAQNNLAIGGIFDLSGSGSIWGKAERDGFFLAIEDFENTKNVKVRHAIEDSAYSNTTSVTALQKLTSVDDYKFIIGPTWEPFAAVIPVCESKKVICIAPSCNTAAFEDPKLHYSFTVWFDDRDYAAIHAQMINDSKLKRVALVGAISPYYDELVDILLKELNEKPVFVERVQPEEKHFRSIIAKIPEGLDGLVVFLLGDGSAQAFYKQWAELRKDRPHIFTDDAVKYLTPPLDLSKLKFKISYSAPDFSSAQLDEFNAQYKKKYGEVPQAPSASAAYDATKILLGCALQKRSQPEQVRDCISNTVNYHGKSGVLSFSGARGVKERKMKVYELP